MTGTTMAFDLMNGQRVKVSQEEVNEFITQVLIPNPDWRHSGMLSDKEVLRFFERKSPPDKLKKVARYILIYEENLAFTAFLFDKSEGHPDHSKEFNMPVVKKLRELYQKVSELPPNSGELASDVHEMESLCMEIGADPL